MITDREILNSLLAAVGALSERLTGERMLLTMQDEDGAECLVILDGTNLRFMPVAGEAQSDHSAGPQSMHLDL